MAVILNCGKCQKRMRPLEPFIVIGDLYLCKACGSEAKDDKGVEDFYKGLDIGDLSWIGFWKKGSYRIFTNNGFVFINTVPIISYPTLSYADQFDNSKYIILAYGDHWDVYDKVGNKIISVTPNVFNNFDAYNVIYIEVLIKSYI